MLVISLSACQKVSKPVFWPGFSALSLLDSIGLLLCWLFFMAFMSFSAVLLLDIFN